MWSKSLTIWLLFAVTGSSGMYIMHNNADNDLVFAAGASLLILAAYFMGRYDERNE